MREHGMDRLTDELRRWSRRPTRVSPGTARTRVLARLEAGGRTPAWRLAAAGAALAAGALALVLLVGRSEEPAAEQAAAPATATSQSTIVHELSSGTKLYIVVRPIKPAGDF